LEFRERVSTVYAYLFGAGGGEPYSSVSQFGRKWGWYGSLYALAKGDVKQLEYISTLNVHLCLQHLMYEKEKTEIEQQELKRKYR